MSIAEPTGGSIKISEGILMLGIVQDVCTKFGFELALEAQGIAFLSASALSQKLKDK
ncbi:hypothetical protein N8920_07290 [Opitutales bacterium]|nr:hypothetical protein [Opitutales bacterium]MDA8991467.1 hypothetical protein [Opitutales bacterium]